MAHEDQGCGVGVIESHDAELGELPVPEVIVVVAVRLAGSRWINDFIGNGFDIGGSDRSRLEASPAVVYADQRRAAGPEKNVTSVTPVAGFQKSIQRQVGHDGFLGVQPGGLLRDFTLPVLRCVEKIQDMDRLPRQSVDDEVAVTALSFAEQQVSEQGSGWDDCAGQWRSDQPLGFGQEEGDVLVGVIRAVPFRVPEPDRVEAAEGFR